MSNRNHIAAKNAVFNAQTPRQVRFSEFSSLRVTEHPSPQESDAAWYTRRDIDQFKEDVRHSARAFRSNTLAQSNIRNLAHEVANGLNGSSSDSSNIDSSTLIENYDELRGIEHLVSTHVFRLVLRQRQSVTSHVLREQAVQKELGENDLERIAQVSMRASQFSRAWSKRVADSREPRARAA